MSWLDDMLQKIVAVAGAVFPSRKIINLIAGSGVSIAAQDNAATGSTDVTIAATGGGVPSHLTVDAAGLGRVPAAGALRLDNTSAQSGIKAREAGNTFDLTIVVVDGSNNMQFGSDFSYTNQPSSLGAYAASALGIGIASSTYFYCSGGYCQLWQPVLVKDGSIPGSSGSGGVFASVAGLPYWCDNAGFVHQLAEYRICLNANFVGVTTTVLQATNLTFPTVTGDVWEVEFQGFVSQASGVAGCAIGLLNPTGAFTVEGFVEGTTNALGTWTGAEIAASGTAVGVFNTIAATKGYIWGKATITVTTGGVVGLGIKPIAGVVPTMDAGFSFTAKRIKKV